MEVPLVRAQNLNYKRKKDGIHTPHTVPYMAVRLFSYDPATPSRSVCESVRYQQRQIL